MLAARVLRWVGVAWLVVASLVILIGYAAIVLMAESLGTGLTRLLDVLSPFNIANYLAILLTLSPGLGALALSDRLRRSVNNKAT